MPDVDAARAVEGLRELRRRTGDADGAQRVAWTDTWITARDWLRSELAGIEGVTVDIDAAGNIWAVAPGRSERTVVLGGHLDSVPDGGWLDGTLNVVAALETLRALAPEDRELSLALVDWADEEGARFGRSLFGSSAAAGSMDPDMLRGLTDRDGVALPNAVAAHGVDLDRALDAHARLKDVVAYLELHIEQGPVLERLDKPLGAVLGTFGVQRHAVRFTGRHAHAGSTPMDVRRDAFLAAARSALAWREDAAAREDVRATTGVVKVGPGIVTAFNGMCEVSLDQRALDAAVLADMLQAAQAASERIASEEGCSVSWERIWEIEPIPFDAELIDLADAVIEELAGTSHRLPSGPLHDAAEMARVVPTVMVFVKSLGGLSHTNEEDTPVEDLELSVRALHELAVRTLAWAGDRAAHAA
jgi:N-carbamoyl-L-amino-acid hydrolase